MIGEWGTPEGGSDDFGHDVRLYSLAERIGTFLVCPCGWQSPASVTATRPETVLEWKIRHLVAVEATE